MSAAAAALAALVARHGRAATAVQALYPGMRGWLAQDGEAAVAYVDTGRAWVAAGPPLAAPPRQAGAVLEFVAAAAAAGRRACLFAVDARLCDRAGLRRLPVGRQAWWHAGRWPRVLAAVPSLREQLRRARRKGVAVRAVAAAELRQSPAVAELLARWQAVHHLAPMQFLVTVAPFTGERRQLFVAEQHGRLCGLMALAPLQRCGFSATEFVRDPRAPNGTVELLFDAALRWAGERGAGRLTLGLLPLSGELPPALLLARRLSRSLFDFRGLEAFKQKLRPQRWQRLWLGHSGSSLRAVADLLAAFAGGPLWWFALRTALRAPPLVLWLFAALLVPWTLLLALAPAAWFPSELVRWSWLSFDLLLAFGFLRLARRFTLPLGIAMAALLSVDAVLTAVQVVGHAWPGEPSAAARIVFALAVLGPAAAAVLLWGGVRRRLCWRGPAPALIDGR